MLSSLADVFDVEAWLDDTSIAVTVAEVMEAGEAAEVAAEGEGTTEGQTLMVE